MTTHDCAICGKPTTSHKLNEDPAVYVCHTCFTTNPDGVAQIEEKIDEIHKKEMQHAASLIISLLKAMRGV